MACPHVSGLAAVLMSMRNFTNAADVKQIIEQNVQVKSQYQGVVTSGGLIDVNMTICSLMSKFSHDYNDQQNTVSIKGQFMHLKILQ